MAILNIEVVRFDEGGKFKHLKKAEKNTNKDI